MGTTPDGYLTQDELVAELRRCGYEDATARRVAAWRGHDLLPPFDRIGGGHGRSQGRERNSWLDGETVINQALWICELLPGYRSLDDLHTPLWMLGYPVPLEHVRRALGEPLDSITRMFMEVGSAGELEDLIGDAAYDYAREMARAGAKLFEVPQAVMEAALNLIFNEGYDLSDAPFEDGVSALEEFDRKTSEEQSAMLAARGVEPSETRRGGSLGNLFRYAPFIKECLSVPRLKQAVDESTEEDWLAVERDVDLLREMALIAHRMFRILFRDLDPKYDEPPASALRPLFTCGKLIVLADLSLRRRGYSEMINAYLPVAAAYVREKCDEKLEQDLAEISPAVASAVDSTVDMMIESFRSGEKTDGLAGG